jgi:NitT/TauT family transport system substrate-binding protein
MLLAPLPKRFPRRLFSIAALVVLSLAGPAAGADKITFAYLLDPAYDAVVWPMKTGKVHSETVEVEMKALDIPALLQATGAKSYDVVMSAAVGVPLAKARGLDLLIMATALRSHTGSDKGGDFFVKADSPYHTLADLKGKTIGNMSLPSTGTTLLRLAMWKSDGLNVAYDGGDFKWVEMPAAALPGALLTGRVDAANLSHSQAYLAEKDKAFRVVARLNTDINDTVGGPAVSAVLVGYPDKLAARPAAFKEFARLVKASADYTRTHVDEVAAALSRETKLDPAFFQTWLDQYYEAPMAISASDVKVINNLWKLSAELGVLKTYPDAASVVWPDAIRE